VRSFELPDVLSAKETYVVVGVTSLFHSLTPVLANKRRKLALSPRLNSWGSVRDLLRHCFYEPNQQAEQRGDNSRRFKLTRSD
jgi:hypothetical protein